MDCSHPEVGVGGTALVCRQCGEDLTWPSELRWVVRRLHDLTAGDLPEAPWFLYAGSRDRRGKRVYAQVDNSASWIASMQAQVEEGIACERYPSGDLTADLYALARILRQQDPRISYW